MNFYNICLLFIGIHLITISSLVNSKRILAIEFLGSKSHAIVFLEFLEALAARGHNVTFMSPLHKSSKSIREIHTTTFDSEVVSKAFNINFYNFRETNSEMNFFIDLGDFIEKLCHEVYDNTESRNLLNEEFDLVMLQPLFNECAYGYVHSIMTKNKAPLILFSPVRFPSFLIAPMGVHYPMSFVPSIFKFATSEMTFWERLDHFVFETKLSISYYWIFVPRMEKLYREELGDSNLPSAHDILSEASLALANTHFSIAQPLPNFPSVIDIGGIHSRPAKSIPKEYDDFLSKDDNKHGFILFSLGTSLKSKMMSESKRQIFVNVFAKLKQRVIWKYEDESIPGLSSNVKLSKWIPQQDLLGDPRIKMFIFHCGLGSMEEAIYHAVPYVGIPFFGDQQHNSKVAQSQGIMRHFEWNDMSEESLSEAIHDVIHNPIYRQNIRELSIKFKDQMESPMDRAIWWTEYVMRHNGAPSLKSAARKLNFFQYHSLDVVGFLIGVFSFVIFIIAKILSLIISQIRGGNTQAKTPIAAKKKQ